MGTRDQTPEDRAAALLESVKPDLLKLLSNAPDWGSVGLDLFIHNGEIIRISLKAEITRKLESQTIKMQGGKHGQ
jgi:hypothetical protein